MDEHLKQINRSKIWLYLVFLIGSALGGYFGNQINWGDYQVSWENISTFYPLITGFGGGIALIGLFYSLFGPRSSLNSNPILSSTKSLSDKPTNSLNSEKKTEIQNLLRHPH
jgi:hypothetical protein